MKRLIPCLLLAMTLPLAAQLSVNAKDLKGRTILISSDAGDVELKKGIAKFVEIRYNDGIWKKTKKIN